MEWDRLFHWLEVAGAAAVGSLSAIFSFVRRVDRIDARVERLEERHIETQGMLKEIRNDVLSLTRTVVRFLGARGLE